LTCSEILFCQSPQEIARKYRNYSYDILQSFIYYFQLFFRVKCQQTYCLIQHARFSSGQSIIYLHNSRSVLLTSVSEFLREDRKYFFGKVTYVGCDLDSGKCAQTTWQ
jgi:hypothetical protein